MKKICLLLILGFVFLMTIAVLSAIDVTIGAGDQQAGNPFNLSTHNSLYETLYYPEEIGHTGVIYNITYYYDPPAVDIYDQQIQIWMNTTTRTDLSAGWISSNELGCVCSAQVDLLAGQDSLCLVLWQPFNYQSGNLVIMTYRSWEDELVNDAPLFYNQTIGTNRTLNFFSDTVTTSPDNPPSTGYTLSGQFPKISLRFDELPLLRDLAALSVTGNTNPVEGEASIYTVRVHNYGYNNQSVYQVKLYDLNDQELATTAGVPVNSSQTEQVLFVWHPIGGFTGIYAKIVWAQDQNPLNNQSPPLMLNVQPGDGATIPSTIIDYRIPIDMGYRNSLFETIYPASYWFLDYLNTNSTITSIKLHNSFGTNNLFSVPTKIWLGNTNQLDLNAGWIPSSQLTQVYDSTVFYPIGENYIKIDLQVPFQYTGGNLVMMVNRPMDSNIYPLSDLFACYTSRINCSRLAKNNVDVLDPANPPTGGLTTTNIYPYAQFISGTENFGSLEGVIRDVNNIPVIGAIIQLGVAQLDAISDVGGVYRFAPLPGGTYQLTVSRAGYLDVLMPFVLADNQDMTLNITLPFVPLVDVSGVVVNSMNETVPVSDALITLEGEYNATTTSDTFGRFTLLNIPMNRFYNLKISKPGFDEATYPIQVGTQNLILGNLLLAERLMRPYNVQAVSTVPANGFNITWNAPYLGSGEGIHYDTGFPANYFNMWNDSGANLPFEIAIRFTPEDLANYSGLSLSTVKFYASSPTSEHRIRVWTGGNQNDAGNLVVDQVVNDYDVDSWNSIILATPILINSNEELRIGIHFSASETAPACGDNGPVNNWKGNLMNSGDGWFTPYDALEEWTQNWNIQGILNQDVNSGRQALIPLSYNPFDGVKGTLKCEKYPYKPNLQAAATRNDRSVVGYEVWRFAAEDQDNQDLWTLLTPTPITTTAFFDTTPPPWLGSWNLKWAIKAKYVANQFSAPAYSNSVEGGEYGGVLKGIITDSITGLGVNNATVLAVYGSHQNLISSLPDGSYNTIVYYGTCNVMVTATGYQNYQQNDVVITNGDTTFVDIALVPVNSNPDEPPIIKATMLNNIYPNPFKDKVNIGYAIKEPVKTEISIYNIKGQLIKNLVNNTMKSGSFSSVWNGTDNNNQQAASGMYLLHMKAGRYSAYRKLIFVR